MADEEKTAGESQSQDASDAGVAEKGALAAESQVEDWEGKYKELQGQFQSKSEEAQKLQDTFDTVYPYIDFDKMQNRDESSEPETVTKDDLLKLRQEVNSKLHTLDFRQKYPELRDYEKQVGAEVLALRQTRRNLTTEELIDRASESVKEMLERERAKGRAEAEQKKAEAAAAGGLGTTASSTDKEEAQSEGESFDDYMARHKKDSAKKRGYM